MAEAGQGAKKARNTKRLRRAEIKGRLEALIKADSETDREKVVLFAARCALRAFLFYSVDKVVPTQEAAEKTEKPQALIDARAKRALVVWRATMLAWAHGGYDSSITAASASADLSILEKDENALKVLRQTPLWSTDITDKNGFNKAKAQWTVSFDQLIAEAAHMSTATLAGLQQLGREYNAMLSGDYAEGETPPPVIKDNYTLDNQQIPDTLPDEDGLGRDVLIKSVVARLSQKGDAEYLTVGLFGDWGMGKSTFIKLLRKALNDTCQQQEHTTYLHGDFNAWQYEHTEKGGCWQWLWRQRKYVTKLVLVVRFAWVLYSGRISFFIVLGEMLLIGYLKGWAAAITVLSDSTPGLFGVGAAGLGGLYFLGQQIKRMSIQPLAKELQSYLKLPSYAKHLGELPVMSQQIKALCGIRLGFNWWGVGNRQRKLLFVIDDCCGSAYRLTGTGLPV